jgi:hypothetical protein
MAKKGKILLVLCVLFGLFLATLSGVAFFYYSHPSKLEPLAESFLSRVTGTQCSIKEISYSRKPSTIRVKGIQFIEHIQGFYLDIPEVSTQISLQGSFGHRTLVLENLRLKSLSLSLQQGWHGPEGGGETERVPILRRLLGGVFSFLVARDIRIKNAELVDGHVSGQWGDATVNLNGMHAKLTPEQFLDIGCDVRVQIISEQLDLKIPRLSLITDQPVFPLAAEIQGAVKGEDVSFEAPQGKIANGMVQARIIYDRDKETLGFEQFRISFAGLNLYENREMRFVPLPCVFEADGALDFKEAALRVRSVHLLLGGLAELKGTLQADLGKDHAFAVNVAALRVEPQKVFPVLPEKARVRLNSFNFRGPVSMDGQVTGHMDQGAGRWGCNLRVRFRQNKLSFALPIGHVQATLTGDIEAKGPFSQLDTTLTLNGEELALQSDRLEFGQAGLNISLTGRYPAFEVKAFSFRIPRAGWAMKGSNLVFTGIEGRARAGTVDVEAGTLSLPELALSTSVLKNLLLSAEIKKEGLSLTAKGKDVHLVELAQAIKLLPPSWRFKSTDSLQAQVVLTGEGQLSLDTKLEIAGLGFEGQGGDFMGQNISLVVEPTLEGDIGHQPMTGSVFFYAKEGEVLLDRFYFDLSKHNLLFNGNGSYNLPAKSLEISDLRFQMENLASVTVKGTLFPEAFDRSRLLVHVPKVALTPIFRQLVVEPYKNDKPFLADLQLGGLFSADLALDGGDSGWTIKGRSTWQDGEAFSKDQEISFKGIELDLPIWYESGTGEKKWSSRASVELAGGLSIKSARLPLLPPQAVEISFKAGPHRLSTTSPLSFKVPGGQLVFGKIVCRDPYSISPDIETSLRLRKIDLEPWLSRIWPSPVQGSGRGKLDPVQIEGDTVSTKGEIAARLFGGRVVLTNVGVKRFLSLAPVIHLDASWQNINLGELTRDTAFGKIEGVLRGQVKNLEIADGQPQKFELFMETVQKAGVPQKISVQALNNIAQIGGGASPFSGFTGALISLFKELSYEKIGVKASLENDVFRINGTVKENGKEYLVKKGGFSGVDVIIADHGSNTISFRDMLSRIKRVTGSKGSPVVE